MVAKEFIGRLKDRKLVEPIGQALGRCFDGGGLSLGDCHTAVRKTVFPEGKKVVPPHAMTAALDFTGRCVAAHQ